MYSYYIERGIPHTVLEALDEDERLFYIASMLCNEETHRAERRRMHGG